MYRRSHFFCARNLRGRRYIPEAPAGVFLSSAPANRRPLWAPLEKMSADNTSPLQDWVGKSELHSDVVALTPIAALSATLDRDDPLPQPGDSLPPLWHWLYFLTVRRASELGRDGHPARGGFLPPVALPRRMWAGGRLQFHHPLRAGEEISRESRIVKVTEKMGRTGTLVFVLVRHEIRNAAGVAITEEHDIVYRDDPKPDDPKPAPCAAPTEAAWTREIVPDETLLFRYSALTFNGHRIHYDYRYVTEVEGYDGLVVHGPLIATLLLDLVRRHRPEEQVVRFEVRALRPVTVTGVPLMFCGQPEADGKTVKLWTRDHEGWLTMEGTATMAEKL